MSPLIPIYYWATRQKPLFTTYSLDVITSGCDITSEKAERELGFKARPYAEGIKDAITWFQRAGYLKR